MTRGNALSFRCFDVAVVRLGDVGRVDAAATYELLAFPPDSRVLASPCSSYYADLGSCFGLLTLP